MGTGFDVTTLPEQLGVIPRAMDYLFCGINKRYKGVPFMVLCVISVLLIFFSVKLIQFCMSNLFTSFACWSIFRAYFDHIGRFKTNICPYYF